MSQPWVDILALLRRRAGPLERREPRVMTVLTPAARVFVVEALTLLPFLVMDL